MSFKKPDVRAFFMRVKNVTAEMPIICKIRNYFSFSFGVREREAGVWSPFAEKKKYSH